MPTISFRSDERGGAHLSCAVERFLLVVVLVFLLLPLENLPYVLECFVYSLALTGTSLPHEKLPVRLRKVQVLELHGDVVVCLMSQRLVVVVRPHRAEVVEPLTARDGRAVDLLLEKVILVQNQNKWSIAEAWLPAQTEIQILLLPTRYHKLKRITGFMDTIMLELFID